MIDRTYSLIPAQEVLKQCQVGDLEAFEQTFLRLQQQAAVEIEQPLHLDNKDGRTVLSKNDADKILNEQIFPSPQQF